MIFNFLLPIIFAAPCIPIDLGKLTNTESQTGISDARLNRSLSKSAKFIKRNLSFIELCVISKSTIVNNDPYLDKYQSYNFWYGYLNTKIPYGHVALLVHPVTNSKNIGGMADASSFLDKRFSAIAIAWCNKNIISCEIIIVHEVLHTLGAKHHPGIHIMAPYVYGPEQLSIIPDTKTEVRRYLKQKGLL